MSEPEELPAFVMTPEEEAKALAVGFLLELIEQVEEHGAKGLAMVHVRGDAVVSTNWHQFDKVNGSWAQLVAGVAYLQSRILK